MSYNCTTCGKIHEGHPWVFAADFPDIYATMSEENREKHAVVSSDQCIIDDEFFCIRGNFEIPVLETDEVFSWGLWARVNKEAFDLIHETWSSQGRESITGPFSARLLNTLELYAEDTLNLSVIMHIQPVGVRPLFVGREENHPMITEQRHGITVAVADQMSAMLSHPRN